MRISPRHVLALVLTLTFGCSSRIPDDLSKRLLSNQTNAVGLELSQGPCCDSLYFAKYYQEKDWFEWFRIYCIKNDSIFWSAGPDSTVQIAMRVRAGRIFTLPSLRDPVLELYDASHAGNGSLSLFWIRNRRLVRFFEAEHAVDFNYEYAGFFQDSSTVFKNGSLAASYSDLDGDKYSDLILRDTVLTYSGDDPDSLKLIDARPIERRFAWNTDKGTFVELHPGY
jgi:hypothetical protein